MVQVNSVKAKETLNSDSKTSELKFSIKSILLILLFSPFCLSAQKWEVGGAIGGGNYMGDLNPTFRFENYQPAGGLFVRNNFNKVLSLKLGLNAVKLHGSDKFYDDPYSIARSDNFIRVLGEVFGQIEYNFFNYRDEKSRRNWTPYFFVGVGAMYLHGRLAKGIPVQPIIPTGVGFRYMLGGKWNLGLEWGIRKTFSDYIDNVGYSENQSLRLRNGNPYDKDWYFVSTISLSYTIYTIKCPFDIN